MRYLPLLLTLVFVTAVSPPRAVCEDKPADANVKLWEWRKGVAVESLGKERMTVYLWFYEWNMFEARAGVTDDPARRNPYISRDFWCFVKIGRPRKRCADHVI